VPHGAAYNKKQEEHRVKVNVLEDAAAIGQAAGDVVCDLVSQKPEAVLGLATGASPVPTYQRMIARNRAGEVSFRNVATFNLDEYCDLPEEDKNSYHTFMREELFSQIDILPENTHFLDGNCADEAAECEQYARAIEAAGGIDLQVLGIGRNGHIGFDEPGEAFTGGAYRTGLSPSTVEANAPYFTDNAMPEYAMTMGVGQILQARKIILIATGASKAEAVRAMLEGDVTPRCPASALQNHPDVTGYLDPAAAGLLER
jgi:glucosamine-6-phosphate deaminase